MEKFICVFCDYSYIQFLKPFKNKEDSEIYHISRCKKCNTRHIKYSNKVITGKTAKELFKTLQLIPQKVDIPVDKYNPKCSMGDNFTYFDSYRKTVKGITFDYQIEKRYNSGRSFRIKTPLQKVS